MSHFIQLHALTFYPPSNLNRDDLGRPKTAHVGNHPRLRISSQCLKRSWRTSNVFQTALAGKVGTRTKRIGSEIVMPIFKDAGIDEKKAIAWATAIREVFSKKAADKKDPTNTLQMVHYTPRELAAIQALAKTCADEERAPTKEDLDTLRGAEGGVDVAMFGRMMADFTSANVEAAVQVAHAFTVNKVALEDDFFTAVDDLNRGDEDAGAGHVDEAWFGSGVFYLYVCIDRDALLRHLGDEALVNAAIAALTEAVATVSPSGKQNSFAARAQAGFMLAEKGEQAPRSLAAAFINPVYPTSDTNILDRAIAQLKDTKDNLDKAYGSQWQNQTFKPLAGEGTLQELVDFAGSGA